ncbi:3'-5' RNA exonuclease complex component [Emydomyces testavorans]|uniref:3'-5' RNA exonuclease complex component n=1 Tax=Emydomyces testavorans TaxID=2070801 RepID=A0AAF0DLT9_9EURO|nr:3'-5' RNA exonuclease complex component [Emydomyces testavorans]
MRKMPTSESLLPSPSALLDGKSRTLLQSELDRKEDIFAYLRNWKPSSPELNIDPICPLEKGSGESQSKWVGNMLKDEPMVNGERTKERDMDTYQDFSEEDSHFPYLWPGDLVLLEQETGFSSGQLAVYVRTINDQQQFYTDRGKWRVAHPNEMNYGLKARAPSELLTPLLPYFPTSTVEKSFLPQLGLEGGVPRPIGRPLLLWMNSLEKDAQRFYSQNTSLLDNIYSLLSDDEDFKLLTLDEIGEKIFGCDPGKLDAAERYAIHIALKRQSFYIVANQTHSTTESYTIRPKRQADVVRTVVDWVRQYQDIQARQALGCEKGRMEASPIHQFVQKTRRLVYLSRKSREPTPSFSVSPTIRRPAMSEKPGDTVYEKAPVESFSETDQKIIKFLRLWVTPPSLMSNSVLKTTGAMIIRNIEMYDGYPMTSQTGYLFLQEIGVVAPWENMHVLSELVALPGHGVSPLSDQLLKECNEFCENMKPDSLVDSMKDLRKDFGNLPVFCVDSPSAAEIDDGFSVEPVQGSEGIYWIHIHVANPSAFIPPDHIVAKGAEHFKRSFYSPERIYPMLPPSVTHRHFSLGPDKPTLTFSAKVNLQGEILDKKVVNGYIKNVVYITPSRLRKLYGIDHDDVPRMTFSVGGELQEPKRPELQDHISEEHQQSLQILQSLLKARSEMRLKKGAMDSSSIQRSQPLVSGGRSPIKSSSADDDQGFHYTGDPIIHISGRMVDPLEMVESTRQDLVSHAMLLGGEVAAEWCKERDIPLVFSGATLRPEDTVLSEILGSEATSPTTRRSKGYLSPEPVQHVALGMEQYTKCTSPLRRYSDLLGHWQIEAALRHEAESKKQIGQQSKAVLPFSAEKVNALIARSNWQNHLKDRAQTMSRDFWAMQLLFRAFTYKQIELPETFQCLIVTQLLEGSISKIKDARMQYMGSLLPFRLRCCISMHRDLPPLQAGDVVDVKLQQVNLYNVFLDVDFVKLVKRVPEGAENASRGFFI